MLIHGKIKVYKHFGMGYNSDTEGISVQEELNEQIVSASLTDRIWFCILWEEGFDWESRKYMN